jgi:short-subunit dehydrogenase
MASQKVALVTGASSGMGKEIAKRLLEDGLTVVAVARRTEKMADLQSMGVHTLRMDVTNENDVRNVVNQINQKYGGVDVLVNNAGFGLYGAMEDIPMEDARYQFDVNLFGVARLTQLILPKMREKHAGTIINISSVGGKIYTPLGAWYHATKHALEGWSDCLRLELADFGINVVIVEPGLIKTEFGAVLNDPMLKYSVPGPYSTLTNKVAKANTAIYERGGGSSPDVIARIVSAAVRAARPKTRYAAGQYARPLIFLRKWVGDRLFDRIVMSAVR